MRQVSQDLSNWQPKAANLTPPDTFSTRKEAVSSGKSYGRKLECDEKITAFENVRGDEKGDLGDMSEGEGKDDDNVYCICLSSDGIGDTKGVTTEDDAAQESLADLTVQQSVMKNNFEMKEEIRKYKELYKKQVIYMKISINRLLDTNKSYKPQMQSNNSN